MKKKVLIGVVVLVGGYLGLAIAANLLIPKTIADSERRLFGIRLAAERVEQDQILLSQRIQAVTSQTLEQGKGKDEEVAALLADTDINRLAHVYLGSDWAVQRSEFIGAVAHLRREVKLQTESRKKLEAQTIELEKQMAQRVNELERRKRALGLRLSLLTGEDYAVMREEINDIDRQLMLIRDRPDYHDLTYRKHLVHKETDEKLIEAVSRTESEVFRLASDYQVATLGTLTRILAEKRSELRVEANKPNRLRRLMSPFNIWPINQICQMPLERTDDGKSF